MTLILFAIFAVTACGGALAVVIARNVVHMAFFLIISLGSVAGLFFLLGADFVGATQLLIYVGGTLVLLIFGVMLTTSDPAGREMAVTSGERILAAIVGLSLFGIFGVSLLAVDWQTLFADTASFPQGGTTRPLGFLLLGIDTQALQGHPGDRVGYLLPFEIASVHLLVVLIGAAYLARAKRRSAQPEDRGSQTEMSVPRTEN